MSSDTSDSIPLRSRLYVETSDYEDSVQSTSSEEITSSVEDSIEVQAPPLADEEALNDLLDEGLSSELPPGFSEDVIRSVGLAARSLDTVDGVFSVGEVISELNGNIIPMTRSEQDELVRLFSLYHVAYAEIPTRIGPGYGVMACRSYTTDATYALVYHLPDESGDSDDESDAEDFHRSDTWGDTGGMDERGTRVDVLSGRLEGLVRRRTEVQRSREDIVSSDEE